MPSGRRDATTHHPVSVPRHGIALSTASVYPEGSAAAFEMASRLGYDGVEIMVWNDPVSQDPAALVRLCDHYRLPVVAVHAPCLVMTQRVWGSDPWGKLRTAQAAAQALGAPTVVVHPPFRWQPDYARSFGAGIRRLSNDSGIRFAVENMFPLRLRGREISTYAPDFSPAGHDYDFLTLDFSHAAVAHADLVQLYEAMRARLVHVHVSDGTGANHDEHLVPGRGTQPCADMLGRLAQDGFAGQVVVEINTRRAPDRDRRERDLAESLAFVRLHLAAPVPASYPAPRPASAR